MACKACKKSMCIGDCALAREDQRTAERNKILEKKEVLAQPIPLLFQPYRGHIVFNMVNNNSFAWMLSYLDVATKKPLPERDQADTYVGYKTLKIIAHDGTLHLRGAMGGLYGVDATAKCFAGQWGFSFGEEGGAYIGNPKPSATHVSPERNCTCGFYGLKERPKKWEYGAFRAQVEFFGRVIHAKGGFRAERQRVLSLEARRLCAVCGIGKAIGFAVSESGQVIAVCADHGVLGAAEPAALTARLGTEVRWAV